MGTITCFDSDGQLLSHFYQWDVGQTIKVSGAATAPLPSFHFCSRFSDTATVVTPTISGQLLVGEIPDVLLQIAQTLELFIYVPTTGGGYRTLYTMSIPVLPRARPNI